AVPEGNVELAAARDAGIPVMSRGEALARLVEGTPTVAVAGTHGKTTTSGMVASIAQAADLGPTWLLGADLAHQGAGGGLGAVALRAAVSGAQVMTYGVGDRTGAGGGPGERPRVSASDVETGPAGPGFALTVDARPVAKIRLRTAGRHNVQNALGAAAAGLAL